MIDAQDIGTWQAVFEFVAVVSVVSNSAIILFHTRAFENPYLSPTWMFILLQYVIFSSMLFVQSHVPDESYDVRIQVGRGRGVERGQQP